jgi:hypothetical protein
MFKISTFQGTAEVEVSYENVYEVQENQTLSRVAIGPKAEQVSLLLEIAESWAGPFGVLYVLVVPRRDQHRPGRYQIPEPCVFSELGTFAKTFKDYFERDGRHHLWIMDLPSRSQLVYDRHGIVYAYGDVKRYCQFLDEKGFARQKIDVPCPHGHHYNAAMDHFEDEIMRYWQWKWSPLRKENDNS